MVVMEPSAPTSVPRGSSMERYVQRAIQPYGDISMQREVSV
jgi:hypothetical protein